jgi:hypothetical protein
MIMTFGPQMPAPGEKEGRFRSMRLLKNPISASLLGMNRAISVEGVATFESLSIDRAGTGYELMAAASPLTEATSDPLVVTPCPPANPAYARTLCVIDPPGDSSTDIDLRKVVLSFDANSGAYEMHLIADSDSPFVGEFRININFFNPEAEEVFRDVLNDYDLATAETQIVLTGICPGLLKWLPGDEVYLHSLDGGPNPPGTRFFRSAVSRFPMGFLDNEDMIAFKNRPLPAVVR